MRERCDVSIYLFETGLEYRFLPMFLATSKVSMSVQDRYT
jgi:hypothetical protein